jgi:hypothetical protein
MGKLGTLKNSSLLRAKTSLRPERKNATTRWASLFKMLVKWKRIRDFVITINEFPEDTVSKIPTHQENTRLISIYEDLRCFESHFQKAPRKWGEFANSI